MIDTPATRPTDNQSATQPTIGQKVKHILSSHGLAEYREQGSGKYRSITPGYIVGADHMGECVLTYQTATPERTSKTDAYLAAYTGILRSEGLTVRPATESLVLIVCDLTSARLKLQEYRPTERPDLETYRLQLLRDTAGMFRSAVVANRDKGRILTEEGKVNIRRKIQEILTMPPERLSLYRLRTELPDSPY